jgi:hypothetical protein
VTPLIRVPLDGEKETVAWAWERPDGGRSFGFRAYPDNPAQRYVMRAKAKWSIAI